MSIEKLYFISQIIVAVGFVISLIFVGFQVRQNTALLRQSMAAERLRANDFLLERLMTDADFRNFHYRAATEPEKFNEDDKYRNQFVNVRTLRTALAELNAYFEGNIAEPEYTRLNWNLELLAKKPEIERAWALIENQYSKKVQTHWLEICEKMKGQSLKEAMQI
tara:strand:- start:2429 stop:2923 length:495 start_codon:yes stop_codon:yes gene_type:complete